MLRKDIWMIDFFLHIGQCSVIFVKITRMKWYETFQHCPHFNIVPHSLDRQLIMQCYQNYIFWQSDCYFTDIMMAIFTDSMMAIFIDSVIGICYWQCDWYLKRQCGGYSTVAYLGHGEKTNYSANPPGQNTNPPGRNSQSARAKY